MHFPAQPDSDGASPAMPTPGATPAAAAAPTAHDRRWPKYLLFAFCLACLGVGLAPQIVAWSPLRHELPRQRLPGFRGKIRVGSASLSWWGPTVLTDVEFDAPDGKPFYQVRRVTENCTAWGSLFRRTEPLNAVMEGPVVNIVLRADGSNVEDALAPVLAHPQGNVRQRTTKVVGGQIRITDSVTGATNALQNVTVDVKTDATDGSANEIAFRAEEADSPTAGTIEAKGAWPSRVARIADASDAIRELSLKMTNASLEGAQPLARRVWPDLNIAGALSGHFQVTARGDVQGSSKSSASGDWNLSCSNLKISSESRIGADTLSPGPTEFRGRFTRSGVACHIDDLHFKTDFSQLDGGLAFLFHETPAMLAASDSSARMPVPEMNLHGELDLVALARLLPHALQVREGTELKQGRIRFDVASQDEPGSPRWTGQLATSRIAAVIGGQEVSWDQPLSVQFSVRRSQGRYEIDKIESQSDVLMLHGGATESGVHIEAACDLQELLSRLGKFLNTDALEVRGALAATADFTRHTDGVLQVDNRLTLDNLSVRRQVTRMIERRAGELQPDAAPEPPRPVGPPPAVEPPRNRKELAAQRRAERQAERQAKTQARRQEREAHRKANQIVEVPVQEWQTVWTDPQFNLTCRSRIDFDANRIEIVRLEVASDGIQLRGKGSLSEIPQRCVVALAGEAEYDIARLTERARELIGPHIQVLGQGTRRFSITGPVRGQPAAEGGARPLVPLELAATAAADWTSANLFGLAAGPGEFEVTLAQGIVALRPLQMTIDGGKLTLAPRVLLTNRPALLAIPAGAVIAGVELTDEFCDGWLKFIAPILSQATRCSGKFSLDVDESQLPLHNLASGNLTGQLHIERGEVLPGPLFVEINGLLSGIVSGTGAGGAQDLLGLDVPLIQIPPQTVEFELHEGRIHHEAMEFQGRGIVIRTRGSVGLDHSLDLVASISISDALANRSRLLSTLKGQTLDLPISGTLRRPRVDRRAIGRLAEQFGQGALDMLLNQGLKNFFERND